MTQHKKVRDVIKTVITQDGEIVDQTIEKHFIQPVKVDNFFMVFFENMKGFLGLKQASDMRLMATLCKLAEFDTGIVRVSRKVRAQICDETKISPTNINKNFKRLIDAGLITGDKGDYTINPNIFWKGSTKTRTELLQTEGLTFKITLIEPQQKD